MNQNDETPPVQILSAFSRWKLLFFCGSLVGFAVVCWSQVPGLDGYQGRRYSTETGRMLLISATTIATVFLPLAIWHAWNFLTRPASLYIAESRLFIYWAYFRSIPLEDIIEVADLGRASLLADSVRLSLRGGKQLTFQTTFMANRSAEVVEAIRKVAGTT